MPQPTAAENTSANYATPIPTAWMLDKRLSRRARGILAEMLVDLNDGVQPTVAAIIARGPEGRTAIQTAIKELVAYGYLARPGTATHYTIRGAL